MLLQKNLVESSSGFLTYIRMYKLKGLSGMSHLLKLEN